MNKINKRTALVTGAASGIGRACALSLAKDGYDIVINYNKSEDDAKQLADEIENLSREVLLYKADISIEEEVGQMFKESIYKFGSIDALINNSGIFNNSIFIRHKNNSVDEMIDTNIKGCIFCSKIAAKYMISQKNGKIINISSISSFKALSGQSIYSLTKGAINSLTKAMAKELAPFGIQVNAIAPGFIDTKMTQALPDKERDKVIENMPSGRFGQTSEVADLVSFLASSKSDYIVGQVITVDGGFSL